MRTGTYVSRRANPRRVLTVYVRVRAPCPSFREKENDGAGRKGEEERIDPEARGPGRARSAVRGLTRSRHRTPGRPDVRSALTCWIRRECDAKVSPVRERLRPGSTSGLGEGARRDGRMDDVPLAFGGDLSRRTSGPGWEEGREAPAPGWVSGTATRSPCHAFSAGSATGSRRSLCHPFCRHYCHRHCTLGSVVPRSFLRARWAPPGSSLRSAP